MSEPVPPPPRQQVHYWDGATATFRSDAAGSWRRYCDALHRRLLEGWLRPSATGRALKTDLFDEAAGDGLTEVMSRFASHVHGIDVAGDVVTDALARRPELLATRADVRALPFRADTFDLIVSNSTLDHFPDRADIALALDELHRVTAVGGTLVITLDNLANPIIALRALLPFRLLRAIGVVPYFVGATTTRRGLVQLLDDAGFRVLATSFLLHVPRVVAIPVCARADRRAGGSGPTPSRRLAAWERLARWPTSRWTGHYVAALAVRR